MCYGFAASSTIMTLYTQLQRTEYQTYFKDYNLRQNCLLLGIFRADTSVSFLRSIKILQKNYVQLKEARCLYADDLNVTVCESTKRSPKMSDIDIYQKKGDLNLKYQLLISENQQSVQDFLSSCSFEERIEFIAQACMERR